MKNIRYIIARVACTINFNIRETWTLRLETWWTFSFLEWSKYLTWNDCFFNKENAQFEAVNNQEECFRGYDNICCMVFLNNMLMALSHMVFDIPHDWIYDQCYPLHAKTTSVCFTFVLIIVNPIILVLVLKITWWEVLIVNIPLKLLGISQAMNYFKVWLRFPYHLICEKFRFDTHNIIKV